MVLSSVLFQIADKVFKWVSVSSHTYTILMTLFLIHYSFIWWINVEHLLCAKDSLVLGKQWRLTLIQEPHRWMEIGVSDRGPPSREVHCAAGASRAGFDLVRDGFRGQVVLELSSAGCVRVCKAKGVGWGGGLKECSSYSVSTTKSWYCCLYLLLVALESHTYHLTFAIM